MLNPIQIEEIYKEFMGDLGKWVHDGIIPIDLPFLHEEGLLNSLHDEKGEPDDLTQYFHVIESVEKVTLFNEQFIIWIVPKMEADQPTTYVLIALNHPEKAHLEIVFSTKGVYNTPKFILKLLKYYLSEVIDTEEAISSIGQN